MMIMDANKNPNRSAGPRVSASEIFERAKQTRSSSGKRDNVPNGRSKKDRPKRTIVPDPAFSRAIRTRQPDPVWPLLTTVACIALYYLIAKGIVG